MFVVTKGLQESQSIEPFMGLTIDLQYLHEYKLEPWFIDINIHVESHAELYNILLDSEITAVVCNYVRPIIVWSYQLE